MSLCISLVNTLTLCSANQTCNSWMLSLIRVKVRNVWIKVTLHKHHIQIWFISTSESGPDRNWKCQMKCHKCCTDCHPKTRSVTHLRRVWGGSDLSHIQLWCKCKRVWQIEQTLLLSLFHSYQIKDLLSDYIH